MSSFFVTHGVTAFAPTMITAPMEDLLAGLENVRGVMDDGGLPGAEALGVHQEGPFLNPAEKGCHPVELLVSPTPERYEPYLEYGDVLISMTLAPEQEGAVDLIRALRQAGVVAAAGHSNGIYHEIAPAIDAGLSHVVHFFCNMSTLRRAGPGHDQPLKRVAGAMETFLYDDRVTTELIGDGWHVGDTLMKLAVRVKGVERVCWVSDAMTAAGMPPGRYFVGGVEAIVEHGIADAATVDESIRYGPGLRLPILAPMENADMVGLDLTLAIHDYILPHLESSGVPSPLLREKVEAGDLGFKTGRGFREWSADEADASRRQLVEYLVHVLRESAAGS